MKLKLRWVEGGGCYCGTSEVAGGGGCERWSSVRLKLRRVEGGGIESSFRVGWKLSLGCIVVLYIELWIEGLVLPFSLNSDNGGKIEVAGG